jgi:site-specific recombinase XerD
MESKTLILFRMTNEDCVLEGLYSKKSYAGIPVFFNQNGVIEAVTDFLIYKALKSSDEMNSVKTYAEQIQTFLRFFDSKIKGFDWKDITNSHLLEFRDSKIEAGNSDSYTFNILRIMFEFLVWAELNKYIRRRVAIYEDDRDYVVSAVKNKKGKWKWPYFPDITKRTQPTPTNDDIEALHAVTIESSDEVGFRDSLIFNIYERTARRMEALQIKVSDIPDGDEIDDYRDRDKLFYIEVTGKRRIIRDIEFLPETMELIRDYIENDRAEVVKKAKDRAKKNGTVYKEPEEVFIDHVKGTTLSQNYISTRLKGNMKKAGVKGNPHRVRAKALTDVVASFDGYDKNGQPLAVQDVLILAAEKAGHSNPASLRSYLALSRSAGHAARLNNIEMTRALEAQIQQLKRKKESIKVLSPVIDALEHDSDVVNVLINFLEDYASQGKRI